MTTLYTIFAISGGVLLLIQVVLSVIGADQDVHVDMPVDVPDYAEHGHHADVGHISFRTVVAFFAFFGIAGLAAQKAGLGGGMTLGSALAAGLLAFYAVAFVMMKFHELYSSGNVHIENAIGKPGRVYLTIPPALGGCGKITVSMQGRTMEFRAVTSGEELRTSAPCRIVGIHAKDTVLVESDISES